MPGSVAYSARPCPRSLRPPCLETAIRVRSQRRPGSLSGAALYLPFLRLREPRAQVIDLGPAPLGLVGGHVDLEGRMRCKDLVVDMARRHHSLPLWSGERR